MKREKTSLEKSHSAWSNTKLTLLCILAIVAVTVFWGTLALAKTLGTPVVVVLLVLSAAVTILSVLLFNKFKR